MGSTLQKGNQYQREARMILESRGYLVETARPKIVWLGPKRPISVGTDFFNVIDLIAVHPMMRPMLVQVTVASELGRKRKKLDGFQPHGCQVEVWVRKGGRGRHFRVYGIQDQYTTVMREEMIG